MTNSNLARKIKISNQNASGILATLLVALFAYTAASKALDHDHFRDVMFSAETLRFAADFLAWFLPAVEVVTSVLLIFPAARLLGFLSSLILMVLFTGYISYMLLFTPDRPCSCGGVLKELTWGQHLIFNIFFVGVAFVGFRIEIKTNRFIAINRKSRIPV